MYAESDLLALSGLQHLVFCERQWGLIHLDQIWQENRLTAEGRLLHERSDRPEVEVRGPLRIVRALAIRSLELGLSGRADVVEFLDASCPPDDSHSEAIANDPATLPGKKGKWRPFPVEFKRGKPKKDNSDRVQLCAQALCLEEMLSTHIHCGALFYGQQRRRLPVEFDESLREQTISLAQHMHDLYQLGRTPQATYSKKCKGCSLYDSCLPKNLASPRKSRNYLERIFDD